MRQRIMDLYILGSGSASKILNREFLKKMLKSLWYN